MDMLSISKDEGISGKRIWKKKKTQTQIWLKIVIMFKKKY